MKRKGLGWTGAVFFVVACSEPAATPKVEDLATEVCDLAARCCDTGEMAYLFGPFVAPGECADRLAQRAALDPGALFQVVVDAQPSIEVPNLGALSEAVRDGRVRIAGGALKACIQHLRALGCNEPLEEVEPPPLCPLPVPDEGEEIEEENPCDPDLIFEGDVGEGGTCTSPTFSLECKDGLVCRASGELGVEGQCVRPGEMHDYCYADEECGEDLYCSLLTGTCQPYRTEGESCAFSDRESLNPDPSTALLRCEPGLFCDPINDVCVNRCSRGAFCTSDEECDDTLGLACLSGRCDTPRAEGLPCMADGDCEDGLRCGLDPSMPDMSLPVCIERLAEGESCFFHGDCQSDFCDPTTATCAPQRGAGEECASGQAAECRDGVCDTSFVPCSMDTDCPASRGCDTANGYCKNGCIELLPDGAMCTFDDECVSGQCIADFCRTPPLELGRRCESDGQCESEFCSLDDERVCAELPLANGERCAGASQCESMVCFSADFEPPECVAGAAEGQLCGSPDLVPCDPKRFFCDTSQGQPTCVPLLETGASCEREAQCRGSCVVRFGRSLCSPAAPPDGAVCDGGDPGAADMMAMEGA